jgi:hypothetical protein
MSWPLHLRADFLDEAKGCREQEWREILPAQQKVRASCRSRLLIGFTFGGCLQQ